MKTRIISGTIAIVILTAVLFLHETLVFNVGFGLVAGLMVYELARAKKLDKEPLYLWLSVVFAVGCPVAVRFLPSSIYTENGFAALSYAAGPYIAAAFAYIVMVTAILLIRHKNIPVGSFYTCTAYNLLICGCIYSLCFIEREGSVIFLVFTFMGAWVADTGAYFGGTFFGKHKLCPEISPKKTVEGLISGALVNAVVFAVVAALLNPNMKDHNKMNVIAFAAVGFVCCFLGLIGDLTASVIKRECGIKDYGNIMPGHGGAMDRFDSLIYISPFMLIMLTAGKELLRI